MLSSCLEFAVAVTAVVPCPPSVAWGIITDVERWPETFRGCEGVERLGTTQEEEEEGTEEGEAFSAPSRAVASSSGRTARGGKSIGKKARRTGTRRDGIASGMDCGLCGIKKWNQRNKKKGEERGTRTGKIGADEEAVKRRRKGRWETSGGIGKAFGGRRARWWRRKMKKKRTVVCGGGGSSPSHTPQPPPQMTPTKPTGGERAARWDDEVEEKEETKEDGVCASVGRPDRGKATTRDAMTTTTAKAQSIDRGDDGNDGSAIATSIRVGDQYRIYRITTKGQRLHGDWTVTDITVASVSSAAATTKTAKASAAANPTFARGSVTFYSANLASSFTSASSTWTVECCSVPRACSPPNIPAAAVHNADDDYDDGDDNKERRVGSGVENIRFGFHPSSSSSRPCYSSSSSSCCVVTNTLAIVPHKLVYFLKPEVGAVGAVGAVRARAIARAKAAAAVMTTTTMISCCSFRKRAMEVRKADLKDLEQRVAELIAAASTTKTSSVAAMPSAPEAKGGGG